MEAPIYGSRLSLAGFEGAINVPPRPVDGTPANPGDPVTFANGYEYRTRLVGPALAGPLANLLVLVTVEQPAFRTTENGGTVTSDQAWDVRFELPDGTHLPHALLTYNGTSGLISARVRFATLASDQEFFIYTGKAGLVTSEETTALAHQDYADAWDCRTGVDLKNAGRNLTPSTVGQGVAVGDAGLYNGASSVMQGSAAPTHLDGLSAVTVEAFVQIDGDPGDAAVIDIGPTATPPASDAPKGLTLRMDATGDAGAARTISAKVHSTAGASRVEGPANCQPAGLAHVMVAWQSGEAAKLFVAGEQVTPSNVPATPTGTTTLSRGLADARVTVGKNTQGGSPATPFFKGLIDELKISPIARSAAYAAFMQRNYLRPDLTIGMGLTKSFLDGIEGPVARPLYVDIGENAAVTFAPLDVAIKPGGAPSVVSVTQGAHGTVATNGTTVTYTRGAGFATPLADEFTYTISADGRASSARVRVFGVALPLPTTYPNGYSHRTRFILPALSNLSGGALADFILHMDEEFPEWKTTGNGGQTQHAAGWDFRVELADGTKLNHRIMDYDAATGRLIMRVRFPSFPVNADTVFYVFNGKAGLAATEEDHGATEAGHLAVINARTGMDHSGNGRLMTPVNVGQGTLLGDAGSYNGASSALQITADEEPTWLNGLSAFQVEAWVKPSAVPTRAAVVAVSTPGTSGDNNAGLVLGFDNPGAVGGAASTIAFKLNTSASNVSRVEGEADIQDTGAIYLCGQWTSGQQAKLFVDRANGAVSRFVTPSNTPQTLTGTTNLSRSVSTARLLVGRSGDTAALKFFNGVIDEIRIRATPYPEGRLRTIALNERFPRAFIGRSVPKPANVADEPPVAMPDRATLPANAAATATVDVPVLANDVDPDNQAVTLAGVTGDGWSVQGSSTRYTMGSRILPQQGAYAVSAGGKTATGYALILPGDPVETGPFADHAGPTVGEGAAKRPLFMKNYEADPENPGRYRDPLNKRQFTSGTFSVDAGSGSTDRFAPYTNYMGCRPGVHGATISSYQSSDPAQKATTWEIVIGGAPWAPSGWSDLCVNPNKNQPSLTHNNHAPWKATPEATRPGSIASYICTLPLGATVAEAQAAANGQRNNHYKAFALRLKRSWNDNGQPIVILRPNHEAQNQNTGLYLSGPVAGAQYNWFQAGLTLQQYNSMMRHFCNSIFEWFGPNIYIAFSPAFETTFGTQPQHVPNSYNHKYDDYFEDENGVVGYNMACASIHPAEPRANTLAKAQSLIDGNGLTDGARYWADLGISVAKQRKIIWGSLEASGFVKEGNPSCHGPTRYWGDTFIMAGQRLNDPANYGTVAYFLMMNSYSFNEVGQSICAVSGHTTTNTAPGGSAYKPGCQAHNTGGAIWNAANQENWKRCPQAVRKYQGHKPTYGNSVVQAGV